MSNKKPNYASGGAADPTGEIPTPVNPDPRNSVSNSALTQIEQDEMTDAEKTLSVSIAGLNSFSPLGEIIPSDATVQESPETATEPETATDDDEGGSDDSGSDEGGSDDSGSDEGGSDDSGSDEGGSDDSGSDEGGSDEVDSNIDEEREEN